MTNELLPKAVAALLSDIAQKRYGSNFLEKINLDWYKRNGGDNDE